jgi:hypothetical protein
MLERGIRVNMGNATGRESYAFGAAVVVRKREGRLHGEGR